MPGTKRLPDMMTPEGAWGLEAAREAARRIAEDPPLIRALIRMLLGAGGERRKRAADVARRLTEISPRALAAHADVLADLLAEVPIDESRTRWHLALTVPRVAQTTAQRVRAARMMSLLMHDQSNVVRCSAIEGMATLAVEEPSLRPEAEELIAEALRTGTPAMRCRARHAARLLARGRASSRAGSASISL